MKRKNIWVVLAVVVMTLLIMACDPEAKDCTLKLVWLNGKTNEIVIKEGSYTLPSAKGESTDYDDDDYVWTLDGTDYKSGSTIEITGDITLTQKCTVSPAWSGEATEVDSLKKKLVDDGEKTITFKSIDTNGTETDVTYNKKFYHIDIDNASDFASVMSNINTLGNACYVINLKNSIDLGDKTWTPVTLNGYKQENLNGCSVVINGNGCSIYNLKAETNDSAALIAGLWSTVQLEINDLTISGATIKALKGESDAANKLYYAAGFIGSVDSASSVKLNNCTLKDSTIESSKFAGGFMAWNSGYDKLTNGAVKTRVDFNSCSVSGSTITAAGSVGGIIGHAGANPFTYNTIENCTIKSTSIKSTDDDNNKAGAIVGTANVGEVVIKNAVYSDNVTVVSNSTSITDRCYGRFVPSGGNGKLTIDGVEVSK